MPDIAIVTAALSSVKTAMEIVKGLRDKDMVVEKAELKVRLAELLGSLADARTDLVEIQETVSAKDARIAELEAAFEAKDKITRHRDAYYLVDGNGNAVGEPLCVRCLDLERRQRYLVHDPGDHRSRICPICKTKYDGRTAGARAAPSKP